MAIVEVEAVDVVHIQLFKVEARMLFAAVTRLCSEEWEQLDDEDHEIIQRFLSGLAKAEKL